MVMVPGAEHIYSGTANNGSKSLFDAAKKPFNDTLCMFSNSLVLLIIFSLKSFPTIVNNPPIDKFSLEYNILSNAEIMNIPVGELSKKGFCFLRVLNCQMEFGQKCLRH
jgi:hypothetical protein